MNISSIVTENYTNNLFLNERPSSYERVDYFFSKIPEVSLSVFNTIRQTHSLGIGSFVNASLSGARAIENGARATGKATAIVADISENFTSFLNYPGVPQIAVGLAAGAAILYTAAKVTNIATQWRKAGYECEKIRTEALKNLSSANKTDIETELLKVQLEEKKIALAEKTAKAQVPPQE